MSEREPGVVTVQEETTSVHKSVTVEVGRDRAFAVFTDEFDSWWNRSHHIGAAELDVAVIEPREGGRWYERGVDGTECDWGYVITWQPPRRVVLAWQLDARWEFDPALVTEVEVTFTEQGPSRTRVDLVHRHLDRMGDAARMREVFEGPEAWAGLLRLYAVAVEAA